MAKKIPADLKALFEDGDMPTEADFIDLIDSMNLDAAVAGDVDIDGGAIDNAIIGNGTPSIGKFTNLTSTGNIIRSVETGITAFAGGGQASATQLNSDINEITVVATAGDSVKLPAAFAGLELVIINNDAADACDVFPSSGDDLGAGVDTAVSLAAGAAIRYSCYDSTNWVVA